MRRFLVAGAAAALLGLASQPSAAQWRYETSVDKMTSKKKFEASLTSDQGMSLRFPYQGTNYAGLAVRQQSGSASEVLFIIEKGQLMCSSLSCSLRVRFDDGQPMTFTGDRPADHSSTAMFLDNPGRFIAAAKKAKRRILIEVELFQNGSQILEFSAPKPLNWR